MYYLTVSVIGQTSGAAYLGSSTQVSHRPALISYWPGQRSKFNNREEPRHRSAGLRASAHKLKATETTTKTLLTILPDSAHCPVQKPHPLS